MSISTDKIQTEIKRLTADYGRAAEQIISEAFAKQIGLPDPSKFHPGASFMGRWHSNPEWNLGAFVDGELVAVIMSVRWGAFAFLGPLCVRPDFWGRGLGQQLLAPTTQEYDRLGIKLSGLFTFPHSNKHVLLYEKFGFWPQYLTPVMTIEPRAPKMVRPATALTNATEGERAALQKEINRLTDSIYEGLDLSTEISAVINCGIGEVLVGTAGDSVDWVAMCHYGIGSEAETGQCYVKFAAAKDQKSFSDMLVSCEDFAANAGAKSLMFGVNSARIEAYRHVLNSGFRTMFQGVAMLRPANPNNSSPLAVGFNRPGAYVLDDWR